MSSRIFNWTNKTSTGFIDDELDHIWADIGDALVEGEGINIVGNTISAEDAAPANKGILQLANDLGGSAASPVVTGIRTQNVLPTAPSSGDIFRFDGTDWAVVQEEEIFTAEDLSVRSGASVFTGGGTNSHTRINFPETADSWAQISTRFRDEWYNKDLTIEVLIRATGTAGDFRLWWDLDDGNANENANGFTGTLGGPFGVVLSTLTTTKQVVGSSLGKRITFLIGRDPDHIDDDIADDIGLFWARIRPT